MPSVRMKTPRSLELDVLKKNPGTQKYYILTRFYMLLNCYIYIYIYICIYIYIYIYTKMLIIIIHFPVSEGLDNFTFIT